MYMYIDGHTSNMDMWHVCVCVSKWKHCSVNKHGCGSCHTTNKSISGRIYRRSGNFRVKKLSYDKFSCKNIFVGTTPYRIIVNSAR